MIVAKDKRTKAMTKFIRSDLFRNFLGGFVLGAIGIVTLAPQANAAAPIAPVHQIAR